MHPYPFLSLMSSFLVVIFCVRRDECYIITCTILQEQQVVGVGLGAGLGGGWVRGPGMGRGRGLRLGQMLQLGRGAGDRACGVRRVWGDGRVVIGLGPGGAHGCALHLRDGEPLERRGEPVALREHLVERSIEPSG